MAGKNLLSLLKMAIELKGSHLETQTCALRKIKKVAEAILDQGNCDNPGPKIVIILDQKQKQDIGLVRLGNGESSN